MNVWQQARQLKHRLEGAKWSGGTAPAFGSVVVTPRPHAVPRQAGLRLPLAVVAPGSATSDEEEPDLITQRWTVWVVVAVKGDNVGETAVLGSNRAGTVTSPGRGLLELEEVLQDVVTGANEVGFRPKISQRSALDEQADEDLGYVTFRGYNLESVATNDRFYHSPSRLAGTALGGGSVSLSWRLPPDRFDRLKVVLRRASGSTAPATVTDGTGVALSADLATSVTDAPGVGTFSYALFGQYDDFGDPPATARNTSAAETLSGFVVT